MKKVLILLFLASFFINCGVKTTTNEKSKSISTEVAINRFGISVIDLNASHDSLTDLSHGVVVESVYSGLPSKVAGILEGDIIVTLGKDNILNLENFNSVITKYKYEYGQVKMSAVRDGKLMKFVLYLN